MVVIMILTRMISEWEGNSQASDVTDGCKGSLMAINIYNDTETQNECSGERPGSLEYRTNKTLKINNCDVQRRPTDSAVSVRGALEAIRRLRAGA